MLGKRPDQGRLFTADTQYLQFVGENSFYGFLARHGRELFRDEDFQEFYCLDNGRTSVPPSRLAIALLLQAHDRVGDEEAKRRAEMDLGWKVALGVEVDARPFAKSTLQLFRAQLVIHDQARGIFRAGLERGKALGYLRSRKARAVLDTTHVLGRGAVEDTYNLLAEGIRVLSRALAKAAGERWEEWLGRHELGRYAASSIKGAAAVDWDNPAAREAFLRGLVADGERLLEMARQVRRQLVRDSKADRRVAAAAQLLTALLWQDVKRTAEGCEIARGTAPDRIPSVHDPAQRHGHKSHGKGFTGHKAAIAVEPASKLITAIQVVAGNAGDGECAPGLVEQVEENTGQTVEQVIGDTAFGSVATRQALGEREVIAPTAKGGRPRPGSSQITKSDFTIDIEAGTVRCPLGHLTSTWTWVTVDGGKGKPRRQARRFAFPKELCRACPRYGDCVHDGRRRGRFVTLHSQEAALQAARALEKTDHFRKCYQQRVVVEHRIARLVQLGIRQARYFGHAKTQFQLYLAATVANLTLLAGAAAG